MTGHLMLVMHVNLCELLDSIILRGYVQVVDSVEELKNYDLEIASSGIQHTMSPNVAGRHQSGSWLGLAKISPNSPQSPPIGLEA